MLAKYKVQSILFKIFQPRNRTLGSMVSLGVILMLFELKAGTAVLFMGSLYGFLITFMNQKVLHSLEENHI